LAGRRKGVCGDYEVKRMSRSSLEAQLEAERWRLKFYEEVAVPEIKGKIAALEKELNGDVVRLE
jgi:hypothetical protein